MEKNDLIRDIESEVVNMGYTIWDVSIKGQGPSRRFTVFLDGRVGVNDCAKVSKSLSNSKIGNILEKGLLEVSSPGVEPALTKTKHFQRWNGKEVEFKLEKVSKSFFGTLASYNNCLVFEMKDGFFYVPFQALKMVKGLNRS